MQNFKAHESLEEENDNFLVLWGTIAGRAQGLDTPSAIGRATMLFVTAQAASLLWAPVMGFIMDRIIMPTIQGMAAENREYRGILYAGLILTEDGPKVLEFNCRFGDPETQVVLPRLESDILPLLLDSADAVLQETTVEWKKEVALGVVLAS